MNVTTHSRTGPKPHHWSHWVSPEPNSGCWLWDGPMGTNDRPLLIRHVNGKRKNLNVTRYIWEDVKGPIPDGLWVLHTCNNGSCVNPDHLYAGTHKDNMRDLALSGIQRGFRQTHCKRGHSLDDAYVYVRAGRTHRHCRQCLDLRQRGLL